MIFECDIVHVCRRSRLGAWIEICNTLQIRCLKNRRSRLGAWIEISSRAYGVCCNAVAPVWERGVKCPSVGKTDR